MKEFRIFGPPGTGKTTYLMRQVTRAVEVVGSDKVIVASFTRAAAAEIAGRESPLAEHRVGTLHSFCYRALGCPPIVNVKQWNEFAPEYALSGDGGVDLDEMGSEAVYSTTGDKLAAQAQLLRARMTPRHLWPLSVQAFQQKWEEFKRETGTIDYVDMIELALRDVDTAPGEPLIGFFDEVQDFAPLELALVRKWGAKMDVVLLAGDDDQAIYSFKGAKPDAFLNPPIPEEQKRILKQSHRVPRAIQALAQAWISRISTRQPKEYRPTDREGEVRRLNVGSWRNPEPLIDDAERYLTEGKTVMFLATCSYMLDPLIRSLRKRAIPFHNPYRRKRGDWNPLRVGSEKRKTTADRVLAFLRVDYNRWDPSWTPGCGKDCFVWTGDDLLAWLDLVQASKVLKHGAKKALEQFKGNYPLRAEHLYDKFASPEAWFGALSLDLDWFESVLLPSKARTAEYPLSVIKKHGEGILSRPPQVIVGTVHSVKGGEADVVYLMPDLSQAGYSEWSEDPDSIRRVFYVGMTRAKEALVICQPAGPLHVRL